MLIEAGADRERVGLWYYLHPPFYPFPQLLFVQALIMVPIFRQILMARCQSSLKELAGRSNGRLANMFVKDADRLQSHKVEAQRFIAYVR